jgi:HSP90 family molecular chaperone
VQIVNFSVDSALLRELGERLVGKPYIALAELVKNGFDADAHEVTITLDSIERYLSVVDNGQGMTEEEFKNFWMRVGSTHKEKQRYSRKLNRLMTGSKGVGRLAVQFLAGSLTLETTSEYDLSKRLIANITWEKAVNAGI